MRNSAALASSLIAGFFCGAAACSTVIGAGQLPMTLPAHKLPNISRYRSFTASPLLKPTNASWLDDYQPRSADRLLGTITSARGAVHDNQSAVSAQDEGVLAPSRHRC